MRMLVAIMVISCAACTQPVVTQQDDAPISLVTDDPSESAIAIYESMHGPVGTNCRNEIMATTYEYLPERELNTQCQTMDIDGCTVYRDGEFVALLKDGTSYGTVAHEFEHVLLWCMRGDFDSDHTDAVWSQLWSE